MTSQSSLAAPGLPAAAAPISEPRPRGWLLAVLAGGYLAFMGLVALPAYQGAATAAIDAVSLGWLLAAGLLVPLCLGVLAQRAVTIPKVALPRAKGVAAPQEASVAGVAGVPGVANVASADQAATPPRDELTGLRNHAAFEEELARQVAIASETLIPVSLAVIDLDRLAAINAELGQEAGDQVLAALGRLIRTRTRSDDMAYRIGGDELAIIMPSCQAGRAQSALRRLLLAALEEGDASPIGREWSFSAGVTSYPELSESPAALRRDAQAALRWAKENGRTDVQLFDAFRDLSEEQRQNDRTRAEGSLAADDSFTTGEQDGPPLQLRFLSADPPKEWVDPRLVMIGLADAPGATEQPARRSREKGARSDAAPRVAASRSGH